MFVSSNLFPLATGCLSDPSSKSNVKANTFNEDEIKQLFYIKVTNRLLALAGGGGHYTPTDDVASRKDEYRDETDSSRNAGNYNWEKTAKDTHAGKNISESESRKLSGLNHKPEPARICFLKIIPSPTYSHTK